ncbi:MAG: GbsR/MarR family transcriptional regulator [Bradymonadia bacterium]
MGQRNSSAEHEDWERVLKARQLDVCDAIGDFIEYWGFKRIHGRVWALVALSAQPLPQVEIAQQLGVSRSLVSGVVAELVERGLLRPTEAKRNTPYTAMTDFWPTVAAVLRSREWLLLEKVKIALEGFLVEYERMPAESDVTFNVSRVRNLTKMTETAQSFLRLVIGFPSTAGSERVSAWMSHVGSLLKRFAR